MALYTLYCKVMKLADMPSCLEGEEHLIKTGYGLTTN